MALIHTQALAKDECFFAEYKSCHSAYRVFEYKYLCKIYYELTIFTFNKTTHILRCNYIIINHADKSYKFYEYKIVKICQM